MNNQKGFTLVELVVVIVILGILSAVAVPKFVDMKSDAKISAAEGVYGAAQSAAALNHAAVILEKDGYEVIDSAADLVDAMDGGLPSGWITDEDIGDGTPAICFDTSEDDNCTVAGDEFVITITDETTEAKAVLSKDGTHPDWTSSN
jgi:MSHA pilin protein MshA